MIRQIDNSNALPFSELVLVTPCDVRVPREAERSLQGIATIAEQFFTKWLKKCDYPPNRHEIFSRGGDGAILVRTVSGRKPVCSGLYDTGKRLRDSGTGQEIVDQALRQYSIPRNNNYFWIFVWLGPGRDFKGWFGWGGPRNGGRCFVPYSEDAHLPRLKTHIHEFGHALGLPHIGPRKQDNGLCSLMGPNDEGYRKRLGRDYDDFCLTPAEAAMLWKHPVFSGTINDRRRFPSQLDLSNYRAEFDPCSDAITVSGVIHADLHCHSVVVVDDARGVGEYWKKGYVGRVDADAAFSVSISEPEKDCGRFSILPCFDNGVNTGDKKHHGLCSAINKNYHWGDGKYEFEE